MTFSLARTILTIAMENMGYRILCKISTGFGHDSRQ